MRSATSHFTIETAQADALFASALQHSDGPSATQIRQAIAAAIRIFGARGCAAQVAQAYGEHPETGGRTDAMGTRRGRWHGLNRRMNLTAKPPKPTYEALAVMLTRMPIVVYYGDTFRRADRDRRAGQLGGPVRNGQALGRRRQPARR